MFDITIGMHACMHATMEQKYANSQDCLDTLKTKTGNTYVSLFREMN